MYFALQYYNKYSEIEITQQATPAWDGLLHKNLIVTYTISFSLNFRGS